MTPATIIIAILISFSDGKSLWTHVPIAIPDMETCEFLMTMPQREEAEKVTVEKYGAVSAHSFCMTADKYNEAYLKNGQE